MIRGLIIEEETPLKRSLFEIKMNYIWSNIVFFYIIYFEIRLYFI